MYKIVIGLGVAIGLLGAFLLLYPTQRDTTDLAARALPYCELEHVAGVEISRSAGYIKVISSLLGGGATYYPEDGGQPVECPVVGPDAMSEECKLFLTSTSNHPFF